MAWHGLLKAEFRGAKHWGLTESLTYELEKNRSLEMDRWVSSWTNLNIDIKSTPSTLLITAPVGYETDLASIPRITWNIISPWDVARAAIIHDLLYKRIRQYRAENEDEKDLNINRIINAYNDAKKVADKVFLAAMLDAQPSVAKWKIYSAYYAVVLFGRWSIIPRKEDLL